MDLELKHLGQTLAIGGFAVYATLQLVRVCRAKWIPRFFAASEDRLGLQHIAVYLALVLAAGVVLQDVSKNIVAQRDITHKVTLKQDESLDVTLKPASFLNRQIYRVLDTESELRFRSLFEVTNYHDDEILAWPKGIFRELQKIPEHHEAVRPHFEEIQKYVPSPAPPAIHIKSAQSVEALRRAVNGIYYDAKNRVYREDTYFHELSDTSDLMDFTRSLTFLCLLYALLYLLFGALGYIGPVARFLDIDHKERFTLLLLSLLYAGGIWLAGVAYRSESTAYDLRIFGYYISLIVDPAEK